MRKCEVVFVQGLNQGFISMKKRPPNETPSERTPSGNSVTVPDQHWNDLETKDPEMICMRALAKNHPPEGFLLPFLKEDILVDKQKRCLFRKVPNGQIPLKSPLLELTSLIYLLGAGPEPLGNRIVSVKELKSAHFFRGPHELRIRSVLERYGNDVEGFKRAAEQLGGEPLDMGDAAYRFWAFPKVPLCYLLWKGDEEFPPDLSVLFDRSIENHLAPDAIWGLVDLVSDILLRPDRWM